MSFANATSYAATSAPTVGIDGREQVVVLIKATFVRGNDGRARLADRQRAVELLGTVHHPDAPDSSVRLPSDLAPDKRGADLVIVGEAISRAPVKSMDIAVKLGERTTALRVHGERVYYRGVSGVVVGPAAPFQRMPIVYERAYGGTSEGASAVERRNPVGRGAARQPASLIDTPAPQIEHPTQPITRAEDAPEPAGFGAIAPHWLPRARWAGTFDAVWRATRMPILPADADLRFYNVAHPELQLPERLRGGERLAVLGMSEEGLFQIDLPAVRVIVRARFRDGRREEARPGIDTVLVEPGLGEITLTLRHAFSMGRGQTLLTALQVDHDG